MYFSYFFLILISQFCVFQGIQTGVGICKPPWAPSHINSTETWQECQPSKMSQWTDPSSLLPTSKDLVLCLAQHNTVKKNSSEHTYYNKLKLHQSQFQFCNFKIVLKTSRMNWVKNEWKSLMIPSASLYFKHVKFIAWLLILING